MSKPKIIAFYLPQFHPIQENNEWFGEGFTEWTNVAKAKPLFKGHYQPRIPADLGFYDLRLPDVMEKQAKLAQKAGISAFCYYHYWFGQGRKILEKPVENLIKLKTPDFPFCLCWANHSWFKKNWNPDLKKIDQKLLLEQTYPGEEDIKSHFDYLLPIFKDSRYLHLDNRLVFVIYDPFTFPDFKQFKSLWNGMAKKHGLPDFYFIGYAHKATRAQLCLENGFDGVILSLLMSIFKQGMKSKFWTLLNILKERISDFFHYPLLVYSYKHAIKFLVNKELSKKDIIPELIPNWDYTARRGAGGLILNNSTPSLFKQHVLDVLNLIKEKPQDKQIIFLKSWNEWGEGNYMEPDLKFGHGYIDALREALEEYES